jgi:hypothetical protein
VHQAKYTKDIVRKFKMETPRLWRHRWVRL